jgi:hypothetical protein
MLTEKDYKEFISLVKRMREAQYKEACLPTYEFDIELYRLRGRLESEVDEYLKKMEI